MSSSARAVLLVAHGSRDPRAQASTRALARTVAAVRPGLDVRVAFLEQVAPQPAAVLASMPPGTVVVPLLLTNAFHGSVDLPAQVAGFDCVIADTLGEPSAKLLAALTARLPREPFDGLVLAAAGTRVAAARGTVESVAEALSDRFRVPCAVGYAAGATPSGASAVDTLRACGARSVVVSSYFLAPGRLYDLVTASALGAGAIAAAPPLGASWPLAELILDRIEDCVPVMPFRSALSVTARP
jgi:sirohydrochlorin ferrochelatase